MADYVPDQDPVEDLPVHSSAHEPAPVAPSPLANLRARLGTIHTLSQREVDQLIERMRNSRHDGA